MTQLESHPTAGHKHPRVYEQLMTIRFDDLDPYGHVNASRYIDFVGSSRLIYADRALALTTEELVSRGCGWFLHRVDCIYKRPIQGLCDILVKTWVEAVPTDSCFPVDFQICQVGGDKVFAEGRLTYTTMNLKIGKPSPLPEWILPYLFSNREA